MSKPHKHAALMLQFAQDAAETETPWERWEYRKAGSITWLGNNSSPEWYCDFEYRRKPKTININGFEVPEPLRVKPENGTKYWIPDIWESPLSSSIKWDDDNTDNRWLSSGFCHLTKEAAELHAKALISFTKNNK